MISVTYTVNGQSATAKSMGITVHKPSSLAVVSDTTNPTGKSYSVACLAKAGTCNATTSTCTYNSYLRQRQYSVVDQFGIQFVNVGISLANVTETLPVTTTCPGLNIGTAPSSFTTFTDSYYLGHTCCLPGGAGCSASTSPMHTIYVNGISVRTETINWTCTGVTLTP